MIALLVLPLIAGRPHPAEAVPARGSVSCPGATYTVVADDFWIRIASRHGVTLTALLSVNKATKATVLLPGQVICLPPGTVTSTTTASPTATKSNVGKGTSCAGPTYTVASGDGWIRISTQARVTVKALLAANKATKATVIRPGQVICLPPDASTPATVATTTTPPAKSSAGAACAGPAYTVVSGDGWIRISTRAGVTLKDLLAANKATKATVIRTGQVLCLPAGAAGPSTTSPGASGTPAPVEGKVAIAQFPVQGLCWFSDSWGAARSGGRKHEGVDLIALQGQNVYAVDDGVLTKQYVDAPGLRAGNGWRLTRADGTYFFYGHLSAFAPDLTIGSPVVAGQIIGYVGKTGAAGTPHVHFEVHPGGGAPVNPTPIVKAVNGCKITAVPPQPDPTATTTTATP
ncbi:MAG: LysM peptidoglycan-binding domain-containing protein [Actinomycetota bacterium]|nr:LysM peptidoglycan-binding domain-containing protein [Actinomycetota bacterium]